MSEQSRSSVQRRMAKVAGCEAMKRVDVPTPSRASHAPAVIRGGTEFVNDTQPVGVSLLAIAECQALNMVEVPTPSRAGSLPHWFLGVPGFCERRTNLWEPGLPAMRTAQALEISNPVKTKTAPEGAVSFVASSNGAISLPDPPAEPVSAMAAGTHPGRMRPGRWPAALRRLPSVPSAAGRHGDAGLARSGTG